MVWARGRRRSRIVDEIVRRAYWDGFFDCLGGRDDESRVCEYASDSPYARYDECADLAFAAGVRYCRYVLGVREKNQKVPIGNWIDQKVPSKVYFEASELARRIDR